MPQSVLTDEEYQGLDEARQEDYRQAQDGRWVLQLEDVDNHPAVKGLASALGRYREVASDARAMKALKDRAEQMEEAWEGLDPEETRAALERLQELEEKQPDVQAQIEQAKSQVQKTADRKVKTLEERVAELEAALEDKEGFIRKLTIDRELDRALEHGDVIKGLRPGAKSLLKVQFRPEVERVVDEETGEVDYRGIVRTDTGEPKISDFVATWLTTPEGKEYLPASGNVGTKSKTGTGGKRGAVNPWAKDTRNLTEQVRISREDPSLAKQMKQAAGVT